jgi:hypothetical protein
VIGFEVLLWLLAIIIKPITTIRAIPPTIINERIPPPIIHEGVIFDGWGLAFLSK